MRRHLRGSLACNLCQRAICALSPAGRMAGVPPAQAARVLRAGPPFLLCMGLFSIFFVQAPTVHRDASGTDRSWIRQTGQISGNP